LRAGRLRYRAVIQTVPKTASATGAPIAAAAETFASVWADVKPMTGSATGRSYQTTGEPYAAGRETARQFWIVTMRYLAGVLPTMRIVFGDGPPADRPMDVVAVEHVGGRQREMQLICLESRTTGTP
jgi:head-tail adaptor